MLCRHSPNVCPATIIEYHLTIASADIVHETMKCVYLYLRPTYRITMPCTRILRRFNRIIVIVSNNIMWITWYLEIHFRENTQNHKKLVGVGK